MKIKAFLLALAALFVVSAAVIAPTQTAFAEDEFDDDEFYAEDFDDDFDDDDEDYEEGFDFGDEDTTIYEVECACGEVIDFDEETLEKGSITCPKCGETLEFSVEEDDE